MINQPTSTLCAHHHHHLLHQAHPPYHQIPNNNSDSSMSSGGGNGINGAGVDSDGPQYAEIYSDDGKTSGGVNPYATTGIFINDHNNHLSSVRLLGHHDATSQIQQQQTLAKYLLSSQSQSNTPKLLVKNTLHNKVKSVDQHQRILQMSLDPSSNTHLLMGNNGIGGSSILNSNPPTSTYFHHHPRTTTTTNPQIPANLDMYLTALKHHHQHQQQQETSDKIRQFVNELLLSKSQHQQLQQQPPQPVNNQPCLPNNPPPPLTSSQCGCNNAQYSSPWNSNGSGLGGANMTSNSNSLVSNLTGNSTLSGRVLTNQAMSSSQEDEITNGMRN